MKLKGILNTRVSSKFKKGVTGYVVDSFETYQTF